MSVPFDADPPLNVNDVLARFDAIVDWARRHDSRLGYFAALYRGVTLDIRSALAMEAFDNAHGAERLTVNFAGRYFTALAGHLDAGPVTHAWQIAFEAANSCSLIVSQHLLLGINTHINLDLGIAAAHTLEEAELRKSDFDKVNEILLRMIDRIEGKLAGVWPLLWILDWLAGSLDETLIGTGLLHMRAKAWTFAQEQRTAGVDVTALIDEKDRQVAQIARQIIEPGLLLQAALGAIRITELQSVVGVIDLLRAESGAAAVSV